MDGLDVFRLEMRLRVHYGGQWSLLLSLLPPLQDAQSQVWSLRVASETEINDASHPSVDQRINDAVAKCRQETDGSEPLAS